MQVFSLGADEVLYIGQHKFKVLEVRDDEIIFEIDEDGDDYGQTINDDNPCVSLSC